MFWQWQTFCDFKEITDISIKRICREQVPHESRMVTITRKDDACLVRDNPNLCFCRPPYLKLARLAIFDFPIPGGGVPEPQGSAVPGVAGRWLLPPDDRLHPLLLPRHGSSEYPGKHQKPLSRSNHVRSDDTSAAFAAHVKRSSQNLCNLCHQAKPVWHQWLALAKLK